MLLAGIDGPFGQPWSEDLGTIPGWNGLNNFFVRNSH